MATINRIVIDDGTYQLPRPLEVGGVFIDREKVVKALINAWKEDCENKPQALYNKIKEKRDNLRLIRKKDKDIDLQKFEISIKICTYNDVLLLMENMFEIKFKELENEQKD